MHVSADSTVAALVAPAISTYSRGAGGFALAARATWRGSCPNACEE
jgi:hypothetical protein